jgi:hypothetical protein
MVLLVVELIAHISLVQGFCCCPNLPIARSNFVDLLRSSYLFDWLACLLDLRRAFFQIASSFSDVLRHLLAFQFARFAALTRFIWTVFSEVTMTYQKVPPIACHGNDSRR